MKLTITEVSPEEFQKIITEGDPVEPQFTGWHQLQSELASAHARIEAIDNALDDASAPDATEAHALDNDPIIERIKLWKYAQDEMGDQLAEAKRLWEVADQERAASRKIAKDASRRVADLASALRDFIAEYRENEECDCDGCVLCYAQAALNPDARQEGAVQ